MVSIGSERRECSVRREVTREDEEGGASKRWPRRILADDPGNTYGETSNFSQEQIGKSQAETYP